MKIRYHTSGEAPRLDQYFKSEKGRNAYHIVGIKQAKSKVARGGFVKIYICEVEKIAAAKLPADADVISFQWFGRGRRR